MTETASLLEMTREMALDAGRIQRESYEQDFLIESKSAKIDLVTSVDRECEARIIRRIQAERPDDAILAEEGGGEDRPGAEWRWVIDPLDGTTNYAHGFPRFCVSIGIEHRGVTEVGVVYDPLLDELYSATRGGGAWLGERRLAVSRESRLDHALVATGFAYDVHKSPDDNFANFARLLKAARAVRRDGSAALDLCYVAAGRLDAYWEFKLHAWDVCAGTLIVTEAGGSASDLHGEPPPPSGAAIISSNGLLHDEILTLLRE
ncbi:MAG: inositol monophosphatase family protein [Myxococcota bacterium]